MEINWVDDDLHCYDWNGVCMRTNRKKAVQLKEESSFDQSEHLIQAETHNTHACAHTCNNN